jgi:hypothetical protein
MFYFNYVKKYFRRYSVTHAGIDLSPLHLDCGSIQSIFPQDIKQITEPGKTRPMLIVQTQALLDAQHPSTLVIPLTAVRIDRAEPLRIRVHDD